MTKRDILGHMLIATYYLSPIVSFIILCLGVWLLNQYTHGYKYDIVYLLGNIFFVAGLFSFFGTIGIYIKGKW